MRKFKLSTLSLILGLCLTGSNLKSQNLPVDTASFKSLDEYWSILDEKTENDKGFIKLHHEKWLMYFIHWRPLTEKNKKISVEYTKNLLLSLWGPNMPFEIKGDGGETTINGHNAFTIDGILRGGAVKTKFVVWNCEETNRQFIADCNINLARRTPLKYHELQYNDITSSFDCHGKKRNINNPKIPKKVGSDKYNISFNIPENWNNQEFIFKGKKETEYNIPGIYPAGITKSKGSYLTLTTESEKHIEVYWDQTQKEISKEMFKEYILRIESDSVVRVQDTLTITIKNQKIKISKIENKGKYILGEGTYEYAMKVSSYKEEFSGPHIFKAFLWENSGKTYFMFTSMANVKEFWNIPLYITPTEKTFDNFIENEVKPRIKTLNF